MLRNAIASHALREPDETLLIGAVLPGEQCNHHERSEQHGYERGEGVFQLETDGVQVTAERVLWSSVPRFPFDSPWNTTPGLAP